MLYRYDNFKNAICLINKRSNWGNSINTCFGAFLGTIPSAFIILIIDPIKALWFIIFIIVLQQLEGNLIYPRVVGSSIGLSALWVMFAMIVGGSLFGIIGMLIGIPIFGVVFKILKRVANRKINEKGIERR